MDIPSMIKEWLRDSAVAFLLIVGGIALADHPARALNVNGGFGYLFVLLIAEIPFIYFLGLRRGFFLWWEYLGFVVCIVSMVVARDWLVQIGINKTLVVAVVSCMIFGCFNCLHEAVRSHLYPNSRNRGAGEAVGH